MAIRSTRVLRRATASTAVAAALAATALVVPTVASADPTPTPSIQTVQQKLDALGVKSSQVVEKYNHAVIVLKKAQKSADAAEVVAKKAQARFVKAKRAMSATVVARYEGGSYSTTGVLMTSSDGQNYLQQLQTMNQISTHMAQVVSELNDAATAAKTAQSHASKALKTAQTQKVQLAKQKTATAKETQKYETLLKSLTAAQLAQYTRHSGTVAQTPSQTKQYKFPGGSKAAQGAVKFALAQVGKPYVFAAAGPDSYDCSGLTMAAYASVGIALPHLAAAQYNYGHHVPLSALKPGDLIFMYQPIGHVTIYIGGGLMVSAPEPGENVQVVALSSFLSDTVGATRLV